VLQIATMISVAPIASTLGADVLGKDDWARSKAGHVIVTVGGDSVAAFCQRIAENRVILTAATVPIMGADLRSEPRFTSGNNDLQWLRKFASSEATDEC